MDFVYKKTSEVPSNFDEAERATFLQEFLPFLQEDLAESVVLFVDAVHPQHNTHFHPDFKDFRQAVLNFFEHIQQYKKELDILITGALQTFAPTKEAVS